MTVDPTPKDNDARLDIRPAGETIGAEIRGLDLAEPLDAGTIADIRQACSTTTS